MTNNREILKAEISTAIDARIAEKKALHEAGAIADRVFDANRTHFTDLAVVLANDAMLDTCERFTLNPVVIAKTLAMKTQDKAIKLIQHLTSERLFSDPYATPIIRNAIPFSKRNVAMSNTDQCATLCEAVETENRAKMKEKRAYSNATAASQASQVRRLLSDLNIGTETKDGIVLNMTHPVVVHFVEKNKK